MANGLLCQCAANDLLDSHVLGHDKLGVPAMERSTRSSLDAHSVEVSVIDIYFSKH